MLQQYQTIKAKHQNCLLFFRLGDFYEMFYDDAKVGSRVLDIVLTSRGKGSSERIPMCGIPYHAADNYISKLIKANYRVAICEQMEDPALAQGIVKRDVIRVISPGTFLDESSNDARYLISLSPNTKDLGVAFIDPTTGTIQTNQYPLEKNIIAEFVARLPIFECIYPQSQEEKIKPLFDKAHPRLKNISLTPFEDWCFNPDIAKKTLCEHFSVHNLSGFGIDGLESAAASCGALLEYLKQMNKCPLRHVDKISLYTDNDYVFISPAAHAGLELDNCIKTLDYTITAVGRRLFRFWFTHPLKIRRDIEERQEAIKLLKKNSHLHQDLKNILSKIPDLEKNISRLSCKLTHARDLLAIRNTLCLIPQLKKILDPLSEQNALFAIEDIAQLRQHLENSIEEEIPLSHPEGKIIAAGYNAQIDQLRDLQEHGHNLLKKMQEEEIKRSGINSLKIGFNNVFGYYIEVTKTHLDRVPSNYIRKQTLVNAERFITPELKEFEEKILTAQEKILKLENALIAEIEQEILKYSSQLHIFCQAVATVDCLQALTTLSEQPNYCCPEIAEDTAINIREGRHPLVERTLSESFVGNDTYLDCEENHLIILTGPNMAGKSTYIRQSALLVIMAQMGSFVPAQSAHIGLVDKIFTRIGAHDDILKGQSTFMVEMNEAAEILNNLTKRSLIILDEIGRGTSTYDGLSLAWAIAEHLQKTKARTLFATHFHELTALSSKLTGIKNYNVAVKEWKDEIIFLHKIVPGSTDDSYGIYVAKLAGIPADVIERAKKILTKLELKNDLKENLKNTSGEEQLGLFSAKIDPTMEQMKTALEAIDVNTLTPLEALNKLQELKERITHVQNSHPPSPHCQ